jgi:enoyl-[acyl-carrier protein] reductase III
MLTPLRDTWCLVLGASSGMGRATALALAHQGANIVGLHFDTAARTEQVEDLLAELRGLGVQAHFSNANAADPRVRAETVARIGELTAPAGGLRVLVHSLAFGSLVPYLPRGDWARGVSQRQLEMTLNVMAHSLVYWVQDLVAAGLLRRGCHVFAMTSAGVTQVLPSYGAVSAAKCALEAHVRQLACELAGRGVAVNALRAGVTVTPALQQIPEHGEFVRSAAHANPHGRLTRPEDVAEAVVLLSGTDSSWITGNTIGVDGGELHAAGQSWAEPNVTAAEPNTAELVSTSRCEE